MDGGAMFWMGGIANGGYGWCCCISDGWPLGIAGEDEADAILGPVEALDGTLARGSGGGCWSTG